MSFLTLLVVRFFLKTKFWGGTGYGAPNLNLKLFKFLFKFGLMGKSIKFKFANYDFYRATKYDVGLIEP
jgi:hypothetical protein